MLKFSIPLAKKNIKFLSMLISLYSAIGIWILGFDFQKIIPQGMILMLSLSQLRMLLMLILIILFLLSLLFSLLYSYCRYAEQTSQEIKNNRKETILRWRKDISKYTDFESFSNTSTFHELKNHFPDKEIMYFRQWIDKGLDIKPARERWIGPFYDLVSKIEKEWEII
jgi:ABC-type multidrug transport system fused ATPase/permease subunit